MTAKLTIALALLASTTGDPCILKESAINNGPPFLMKSINADTVDPQATVPHLKKPKPQPVDNSTPHTTVVRCEDGIYGIQINNELRTVEVTCWEHGSKPKK